MYAVIRRYRITPGLHEQITAETKEQFLPRLRAIPGFVAYYMMNPVSDQLVTISMFADQSGARKSTEVALEWVRTHPPIAESVLGPPEVTEGEVAVQAALEPATAASTAAAA